jgi:FMN phosphatase YigB (HAD superfamily)
VFSCNEDSNHLKEFLTDENKEKIAYDSKALYAFGIEKGIDVKGISFCMKLAAYLENPNAQGYDYERLAASCDAVAAFECDDTFAPFAMGVYKHLAEFVKKENLELYDAIVSNLKTKKYYDVICDNDIIKLIENSKVVSFDVFDTLLIRPYVVPTDLFKHMELHYDADGFYDARIKAESVARKLNKEKEDVTLDEIYKCISPEFKYLKNKELLFEKQMLMKHPKNYDIYRAAVNMNKKIIVTSDMYLPSDFLKDVLKKNGYDHIDAVYVSGEYNKAKWSGNLFKQVIKDLKINPEEVLHIGDNKQADIEVPKSLA